MNKMMTLAMICAATVAFAASDVDGVKIPLSEHPRPDWERPQWVNLNGQWDFGFEKGAYDRKITVPFGWGCEFSGVKNEKGKDTGYYRRTVKVPPEAVKDGKATIRLESDAGLAVYGPRFGRYPLGPVAVP